MDINPLLQNVAQVTPAPQQPMDPNVTYKAMKDATNHMGWVMKQTNDPAEKARAIQAWKDASTAHGNALNAARAAGHPFKRPGT